MVLAEHPLCGDPDGRHPGIVEPATVADHIVPLREWERDEDAARRRLLELLADRLGTMTGHMVHIGAWSLENGQGLCASCHAVKSGREAHA